MMIIVRLNWNCMDIEEPGNVSVSQAPNSGQKLIKRWQQWFSEVRHFVETENNSIAKRRRHIRSNVHIRQKESTKLCFNDNSKIKVCSSSAFIRSLHQLEKPSFFEWIYLGYDMAISRIFSILLGLMKALRNTFLKPFGN